ncbi:MAG: tetratricopeptide repeat protein [Candidatus Omnitrophica bacterium]|nr:tetratricopeptide repeat protein [Candidatus Omnitrophota bacterium]
MMSKINTPRKHILVLILITLSVWGISLQNKFSIDDTSFLGRNSFYASLDNIHRIFSDSYITKEELNFSLSQTDKASGSVAYRPAADLPYFFEFALWGKNPFGFHLTNLLIHVVNVCLAYCLLLGLFHKQGLSFLAALLFSIHPVQSEAVCAIGFRADLLVTLWVLLSVLSWMAFRDGKKAGLSLTIMCYLLALFSKEPAILLPLWLLVFDRWKGIPWKKTLRPQILLWIAAGFYLILYFFIFPNRAIHALEPSWADKLSICGKSWTTYILYFFAPTLVTPFPPHYWPFPQTLSLMSEIYSLLLVFILAGILVVKRSSRERPYHLMGLWAVFFFFPASGIIVNPNPVALRYLYFPGLGIYLLLAVILWRIARLEFMEQLTKKWKVLFLFFFLGMCLIGTFINIGYWKDRFTIGHFFSQEFPDHFFGHFVLGQSLGNRGEHRRAVQEFAIALDDPRANDPLLVYSAGLAYWELKDYTKAQQAFEFLIERGGKLSLGYFGMGILFYSQNKYVEAAPFFEKALTLDKTPSHMIFLLQTYFNLGDTEKIEELIKKSKILFPKEDLKRRGHRVPQETSAVLDSPSLLPGDMEFYFASQPKKRSFLRE